MNGVPTCPRGDATTDHRICKAGLSAQARRQNSTNRQGAFHDYNIPNSDSHFPVSYFVIFIVIFFGPYILHEYSKRSVCVPVFATLLPYCTFQRFIPISFVVFGVILPIQYSMIQTLYWQYSASNTGKGKARSNKHHRKRQASFLPSCVFSKRVLFQLPSTWADGGRATRTRFWTNIELGGRILPIQLIAPSVCIMEGFSRGIEAEARGHEEYVGP